MALRFDLSLDPHYGEAVQLSRRVARLLARNPGPFTFRGTGVYIVGDGKDVAVIDPGPDLPEHVAALKAALDGRVVRHILITHNHNDHSPAAIPLQQWSGAPIYGVPLAAEGGSGEEGYDRAFRPDIAAADGAVIAGDGFTLDCVFTPGHTANHMCYGLCEENALFTGDHVMGWSTTVIAPPGGSMGAYMRSLEKLIARDDAILYPTHGSPIAAPRSFLRALLTHRRMREGQVAAAISQGTDTVAAIVSRLYAELAPALIPAASLTVAAHLDHMMETGRVARQDDRYRLV